MLNENTNFHLNLIAMALTWRNDEQDSKQKYSKFVHVSIVTEY